MKLKRKNSNLDNVIMLLTLYKDTLKAGKDYEDWAEAVANLWKEEKVNKEDIEECINHGVPGIALIEVSAHHDTNASGLTFAQARWIAGKVQMIFLAKAKHDGRDMQAAFIESDPHYTRAIDEIFNETYDKEKLKILNSLPPINGPQWDLEAAALLYDKIFN